MSPRLPLAQAARCCRAPTAPSSTPSSLVSLFAALSVQTRSASILASLADNRGAYNKRIRKGRGPSSGYGKTSGRGHNGQKQKGKIHPWFQGGQTPLIVSHGRKGFVNHLSTEMTVINIDKLQEWIDLGRIDASKPITPKELIQSGIMGRTYKDGIKLLARGNEKLTTPINILVSRASASAIAAVEAAGGTVKTRYFTHQALQRLVKGESVCTDKPLPVGRRHVKEILEAARRTKRPLYRLPDPTGRWEMEYYRDPAHRGYLSHMLKPGESPSLYFRVPVAKTVVTKSKSKKELEREMNPLLF